MKHQLKWIIGIAAVLIGGFITMTLQAQEPTNLTESYETWRVKCQSIGEGSEAKRICQMSQEHVEAKSKKLMLAFAISQSADGETKATVVAPFGLRLADGMKVEIDGNEVVGGAFKTCLPVGCIVEMDVSEAAVRELAAAETASVRTVAATGQEVRTQLSLKGFSAAFERLTALATS